MASLLYGKACIIFGSNGIAFKKMIASPVPKTGAIAPKGYSINFINYINDLLKNYTRRNNPSK